MNTLYPLILKQTKNIRISATNFCNKIGNTNKDPLLVYYIYPLLNKIGNEVKILIKKMKQETRIFKEKNYK